MKDQTWVTMGLRKNALTCRDHGGTFLVMRDMASAGMSTILPEIVLNQMRMV
ncbi:MAG: hypothetical protein V1792_01375 [Pseudomonadota bacterium]